jgi:hypothetical protein
MGMQTQEEVIDILPDNTGAIPPAAETPVTETRKRTRGISGMKQAEKIADPVPESPAPAATTAPEPSKPEEAPAPAAQREPMNLESHGTAQTLSPEETPKPAAETPPIEFVEPPKPKRCELVSINEVGASTPAGVALKIELSGEFNGIAYYNGAAKDVPARGAVADVVIEKRESRQTPGKFVNIITAIVHVG